MKSKGIFIDTKIRLDIFKTLMTSQVDFEVEE